jgi:alpha-amylase/alpha-mannosidase (GH57 family)
MRREDRPLHDAWVAADDGHSGLAQPYHHTILPLASMRDRRTEMRWGLRDFKLRFGRDATGVWLPETAVDHATLRLCADEGVRWTILAPWQAAGPLHGDHPRRVEVGASQVAVLFYDANLSATLSFDSAATTDADRFARLSDRACSARWRGVAPVTARGLPPTRTRS